MPESMLPEEIREIRKALKLTQAQAGALLGGGPRAFAKYEAGVVEPSAGLVKLLRLLEGNPSALAAVGGKRLQPTSALVGPFACTGEDVMHLREWELPQFLRSLLHAEAEANGLAADGIHVAEEYFVADGGEDAHIRWKDGPDRTPHLPARYTQFQIKTGAITPAKAGREVLAKDGSVKGRVRAALEEGAHYVLLCTTSLTGKKAEAMAEKLLASICAAGLSVDRERIHVRDADQVAAWANNYPAIVARLRERSRPGSSGPFRSLIQWTSRTEHVLSPFVEDSRLPPLKDRLFQDLSRPRRMLRVLGAAGVGKSRLVLESLWEEDARFPHLNEFVLYADLSEVEETAVLGAARTLADTEARAVVVMDDCPQETHDRLAGIVMAPGSRLSLVTIDNNDADARAYRGRSDAVHVGLAPPNVTETIVDRKLPELPFEDRPRLLLFSRGYPEIAVRVAAAWAESRPMPYSMETYFVDAFVTGRNDPEAVLAIRTAMLVAAFGTVRQAPAERSQVAHVAKWGRGITAADMHAALDRLVARGVVQRRGGLLVLQPRPVAMQLTERQWREWSPEQWTALLAGDASEDLRHNAAR